MSKKYFNKIFKYILLIVIVAGFLFPHIPSKAVNTLLTTEKTHISFGTISYGDITDYKTVTVFNNSDKPINIGWEKADSCNMIDVDAPSSTTISAGGYTSFYVSVNDNLDPGKYTSSLYVYDADDSAYNSYIRIEFTVTVLLDAPYVKDISIAPSTGNVVPGSSMQFISSVETKNDASTRVYWDVQGGYSNSTYIDGDGVLYIGDDETAPLLKVTATSQIDSSVNASALISVDTNHYAVATYSSNVLGGNVSYSASATVGDNITITAFPYLGYTFDGWYLDGQLVSTNCKMTVTDIKQNYLYEARFSQCEYEIKTSKNHPNSGVISSTSTIKKDDNISLLAIPNDDFKFDGWYEGNKLVSEAAKYIIMNIDENKDLTARFSNKHMDIQGTAYPVMAGEIDGLGQYDCGDSVTLTAVPSEGYELSYWTINGDIVGTGPELTLNKCSSDTFVKAHFVAAEDTIYNITAGTTTNDGRISCAGEISTPEGSSVLYTINPYVGYEISDVCVDGYSVGSISTYTFKDISADHFIIASFTPSHSATNIMPKAHTDSILKIVEAYDSMGIEIKPSTKNINGNNVISQDFIDEYLSEYIFSDRSVDRLYDLDEMDGLLGILGLNPVDASKMLATSSHDRIISEAENNGYLNIYLYDEMSDSTGRAIKSQSMQPLRDIAFNYMSADDYDSLLDGATIDLGIYVLNASSTISAEDKELIDSYKMGGIKIDENCYFEMFVAKNIQGYVAIYRDLPHPVTISITIPEDMRLEGRDYYILNVMSDANGDPMLSCITDEDDSPNTITFTTSTLSIYALAYADEPTFTSSLTASPYTLIVIGLCAFCVVAISLYIIIYGLRKKAKHLQ